MYALGWVGAARVAKKVVVKRISAMGSPKNRRAPHSPEGEKRGRAASYRDKEFFFENVATIFFSKKSGARRPTRLRTRYRLQRAWRRAPPFLTDFQ